MPLDIDYTYRTVGNHPYKIGKAYRLDYETLIELEIKAAPRGDFFFDFQPGGRDFTFTAPTIFEQLHP